jgi:hypothetical protein
MENMKIELILKKEEENDGLKHYYTQDEEFEVIERPDNFFLLYKLNKQDDCYDWTETYHNNLEECKEEIQKLID